MESLYSLVNLDGSLGKSELGVRHILVILIL